MVVHWPALICAASARRRKFGAPGWAGAWARAIAAHTAETLARSGFRFDLPAGVTSFAGVAEVPELGALIALGVNKAVGDAGLILGISLAAVTGELMAELLTSGRPGLDLAPLDPLRFA